MPCYDGGSWGDTGRNYVLEEEVKQLRKTVERFEAVLCGIMTANPAVIEQLDWQEVGITKQQHLNWWKEHQLSDAQRRKLEFQRTQVERKQVAKQIAQLQSKLKKLETKPAKKKAAKKAGKKKG